jgi:hypothetical protein
MLKLKDFPPTNDFRQVMARHHDDFVTMLTRWGLPAASKALLMWCPELPRKRCGAAFCIPLHSAASLHRHPQAPQLPPSCPRNAPSPARSPPQLPARLLAPHRGPPQPRHPAALVHQAARPGPKGIHRLWQVGRVG